MHFRKGIDMSQNKYFATWGHFYKSSFQAAYPPFLLVLEMSFTERIFLLQNKQLIKITSKRPFLKQQLVRLNKLSMTSTTEFESEADSKVRPYWAAALHAAHPGRQW
jgi:hypothetical protein